MARNFPYRMTPEDDTEVGSPEEAQAILDAWRASHPFSPSGHEPKMKVRSTGSAAPKGEGSTGKGIVTLPDGTAARSSDGKPVGDAQVGRKASPTSSYVSAALAKNPAERNAAEMYAIKQRREYEDYFQRAGGKVEGALIGDQLDAEAKANARGVSDGIVAGTYQRGVAKGLESLGFNPDGTSRDASTAAGKAAPKDATSPTSAAPGEPQAKGRGFAMRTMADGTVRTASGLRNANNSSMASFDTQQAALAFYGLASPKAAPAPARSAMPAPTAAAPAPSARPAGMSAAASSFFQSGKAPAEYDAINNAPAAAQDATAAKTTSPTAKLGMAGTSIPTTPAKVAPQPAQPTTPYPVNPFAIDALVKQSPQPNATNELARSVADSWRTASSDAIWNSKPNGRPLYPKPDLVHLGTANREIAGIPKKSAGYQKKAEDLMTAK